MNHFVIITISGLSSERGLAVTWSGQIVAPSEKLLYEEAFHVAKKHFKSRHRGSTYSEYVVDFYRAVVVS